MKRVATIPVEQAKQMSTSRASSAEAEQYRKMIRELPEGEAEQLELDEGEKFATIRQRLIGAGKKEGVSIAVRKSGDNGVLYWKEGPISK